jgi:hypothetical protein
MLLVDQIEQARARARHCAADVQRLAARLDRARTARDANELRHEIQLRSSQCAAHEQALSALERQAGKEMTP